MKMRMGRTPAVPENVRRRVGVLVSLPISMILTIVGLCGTVSTVFAADESPANPLQPLKQRNIQIIEQINLSGGIQSGINPRLAEHAKKFQPWNLEKLTPSITVRTGEYSVYRFVETSVVY